jgi:hypothetical protein
MDEGADRRGTFHGIGKPHIEGYLGRFPAGAHEEKNRNRRDGSRIELIGVGEDFCEIQTPYPVLSQTGEEEEHSQDEPEVSDPVDHKSFLPGVGGRILFVPETDQKIRTEAHALPSHKHEKEIVGQYEIEHHEDEEVEVGEISGKPLIVMHVSNGVDMDKKTDSGHDKSHQNGKRIDLVADHGVKIP